MTAGCEEEACGKNGQLEHTTLSDVGSSVQLIAGQQAGMPSQPHDAAFSLNWPAIAGGQHKPPPGSSSRCECTVQVPQVRPAISAVGMGRC